MLGLPGDFTPPSRFVRAVAFTQSALPVATAEEGIHQAFHILNQFDIPKGAAKEPTRAGASYDYTPWTAASDLMNHRYYFHTFDNRNVRMVDLAKMDLAAKEIKTFPMNEKEIVEDLSEQATTGGTATAENDPRRQELKQLDWLIGDWVDESPNSLVTTTYHLADDHRAIESEFHVHINGKPAMTGTQRIAWDPQAKKLRSWVYDSEGGLAEGVWTCDGDQWIVKMTGASHDGQVSSSTNVISRVGKDRLTWQSRDRAVGAEMTPDVGPIVIVRKAPQPQ
jgi:hypothetical protein